MENEEKETISFLIFSVNSRTYAIDIALVQEVAQNAKVHQLPFVPPYIEGVINSVGTAYVAVNPIMLFPEDNPKAGSVESKEIQSQNFLVFKRDDDQFCMHISSIEIFYEVSTDDLKDIIQNDFLLYKNRRIKIFNPDEIEKCLLKDLTA